MKTTMAEYWKSLKAEVLDEHDFDERSIASMHRCFALGALTFCQIACQIDKEYGTQTPASNALQEALMKELQAYGVKFDASARDEHW